MSLKPLWQSWADHRSARAARRAPPARGFALEPEPRALGLYARGRQIAEGSFHLAGKALETRDPWAAEPPSAGFAAELHGFGWLDHLAAFGEPAAREAARRWLAGWIQRCGTGRGPGWRADLTGRRVLRWIEHGLFLTVGAETGARNGFFAALGRQTEFLKERHMMAEPGLPRIEALAGWLHAGLMLKGMKAHAAPALAALADEAAALIAPDGGIPSRNPEELLMVVVLLGWSRQTLERVEIPVPEPLAEALLRGARALRALRHADGGLARFHGGGAGPEGHLDRALSLAAPGDRVRPLAAMGYVRLEGGRTTVIADAAPPPGGAAAFRAQASTLAFELTSGRRPLVVSGGSGRDFGADWDMAGRATSASSALSLEGISSARLGPPRRADGARALTHVPRDVTLHRSDQRHASALILSHDGWLASHGLTHTRHLDLSADGRALMGEDALAALAPADRRRLERLLAARGGIGYSIRFHLHPEADASLDMNGSAVSAALPSGEIWVFRFDGPVRMSLEPSVWLEPGRRAPRPCRQIVLRGTLDDLGTQTSWTLAKAQDTPLAIRDTGDAAGRDPEHALPPEFFDWD